MSSYGRIILEHRYLGRKIKITLSGTAWHVGMIGVVDAVSADGLLYGSWGRLGLDLNAAEIEIVV